METPPRPVRHLPQRAAKVKTPNRRTRSTAAHFSSESSDDDILSTVSDDDLTDDHASPSSARKRKLPHKIASAASLKKVRRNPARGSTSTPARTSANAGPASSPVSSPARPPKRKKTSSELGRPLKPRSQPKPEYEVLPVPGRFPEWKSLPYLVWLDVFDFLAFPLRDPSARFEDVITARRSLLASALACKVFTEPALTGLYKSPCLSIGAAHYLAARLRNSSNTTFNYRPKIEILRIDVGDVLAYKYGGNYLSLKDLIQDLPRLKVLELVHSSDQPPYRKLDETIKWKYPDELFEALGPSPRGHKEFHTELSSWRWSSRLAGESCSLSRLPTIHNSPSFINLRKVAFINYQVPSLTSKLRGTEDMMAQDRQMIHQLGDAINALPQLQHLVLESSTAANGELLEMLPKTLSHLELINCWEVWADEFSEYLISHGYALRRLTLDHCQNLSLGFLPVLAAACPNLTHLHMNFSYFRFHEFHNDSNPGYGELLDAKRSPTWPATMQSIDLENLRQWDLHTAKMFFQSLVDSAPALPDLRRLILKGILDISWRERAAFRDNWIDKTTRVFLRKSPPPKPVVTARQRLVVPIRPTETDSPAVTTVPESSKTPVRRSTRIAEHPEPEEGSPSGAAGPSRAEVASRELRRSTRPRPVNDADDELESEDELQRDNLKAGKKKQSKGQDGDDGEFVQGLCDIVDVRIDNKKLVEHEMGMEDFLDTSDDTDEEWDADGPDEFE